MVDLSPTIVAKSDQLNADDLIGTERTIKITRVTGSDGDQPISIHYEGGDGKPWKPCKSMRRVLVQVWGAKGDEYVGRSLTLFRDPNVTFGGANVGGVRISHMSNIDKEQTFSLTVSRMQKRPYTVKPLVNAPASAAPAGLQQNEIDRISQTLKDASSEDQMRDAYETLKGVWPNLNAEQRTELQSTYETEKKRIEALADQGDGEPEDTFPGDMP